jgi:hypothetical protein
VEIFMPIILRCSQSAFLFRYARKLVVAWSFLRDFIVFRSAMAACHRTADGLLPLGA